MLSVGIVTASAQQCAPKATRACDTCPWRISEPTNGGLQHTDHPGQYSLIRKFETKAEMLDGWLCYMGGTGYPDPAAIYTQPDYANRFGRGYFYETGDPPITEVGGTSGTPGLGIPWLADPTAGMNRYDSACTIMNDLITDREDGQPGFSLRGTRPQTVGNSYTLESEGSSGWPSINEAWTLRLESKDLFNGGLIVISVNFLPYGSSVWPAFWMVGSEPNDWASNRPKRPGMGIRNYWPYRGEIDIIEYTNAYTIEQLEDKWENHVTLHTQPGCYSNRSNPNGMGDLKAGNLAGGKDCNAGTAFTGCSVSMGPNTVGHPKFLGGIYVCNWVKDEGVECWFFNKNETGTYGPEDPLPDLSERAGTVTMEVTFAGGSHANMEAGAYDVLHMIDRAGDGTWVSTCGGGGGDINGDVYSCRWGAVYPDFATGEVAPGTYTVGLGLTGAAVGWATNQFDMNAIGRAGQDFTFTLTSGGAVTVAVELNLQGDSGNSWLGTTLSAATVSEISGAAPSFPPGQPPMPALAPGLGYTTSPIDFATATEVNVADLGPPDLRHDLSRIDPPHCKANPPLSPNTAEVNAMPECAGCHSSQITEALSDMRFIFNTVVCGQWAGNIDSTAMPGDPEGFSYSPEFLVDGATPECEQAFRDYIGAKPKVDGNTDYLPRRFDWDVDFVKLYT